MLKYQKIRTCDIKHKDIDNMVLQINANLRFPALLSLEYIMNLVNPSLFSSLGPKINNMFRIKCLYVIRFISLFMLKSDIICQ